MSARKCAKESYFWQKHLRPWLDAHGFVNNRLAFNGIGETDCFAYRYPWFFGIELKRISTDNAETAFRQMDAALTAAQRLRRKRVVASGGLHVVMAPGHNGWLYATVTQKTYTMGVIVNSYAIHGNTMADAIHCFFKKYEAVGWNL